MSILFKRLDVDEYYEIEHMEFLPQKGNFIFLNAMCYEVINIKFTITDVDEPSYVNTDVVVFIEPTTQKDYFNKIGLTKYLNYIKK